jgi:hypothetical protein
MPRSAEIEYFPGFPDSANCGTRKLSTLHQQTEDLNYRWLGRRSHQRHGAVAPEQVKVSIQIVLGENRVQDEIKAVDVLFHLRLALRDDNFVYTHPPRVGQFVRRPREQHGMRAKGVCELRYC